MRRARGVVAVVLCGVLMGAACREAAPAAPAPVTAAPPLARANVLLVTIDTLRADRVGAYGHTGGLTPTIDRLAREGVRLADVHAHVPVTLPSHTALMTGAYPFANGVRDNGSFRFDGGRPTLASALKGAGYRTGAFVSSFVLDGRFGLATGFDRYDSALASRRGGGATGEVERPAEATLAAASAWIGGADATTPWFAWVHLYDPHEPYAPPAAFRGRATDPYDAEIAYADAALGDTLAALTASGRLAHTVVVVAADHGESLGDHGERTHGLFAYEATLRVPLVLWAPGALAAQVLDGPARLVDVLPTILDLTGVAAVQADGRSLWPAMRERRRLDDVDTYFEALNANLTRHWAPLTGLVAGGKKFIDLPVREFFDLGADPREQSNLYDVRRAEADVIARRLFALRASGRPATPSAVDPEAERRLRSLGYVTQPASGGTRTYG